MHLKREMAWPQAISSQDTVHRAILGIPTNWDTYMQRDSREWNVNDALYAKLPNLDKSRLVWPPNTANKTEIVVDTVRSLSRDDALTYRYYSVAPYKGTVTQKCRSWPGESSRSKVRRQLITAMRIINNFACSSEIDVVGSRCAVQLKRVGD